MLLLWKMFDSQDFMGFTPDEALRAWELRAMGERASQSYFFFSLGGKVTFLLPNMLILCPEKNLCKDQVFANIHAM